MGKHTPGPWLLSTKKTSAGTYHEIGPNQGPKSSPVIVMVDRNNSRLADARLIAAAPELLDTLEALLKSAEIEPWQIFEGSDEDTPVYDNDSSWFTLGLLSKIRAAIANAKGGA